MPRKTTRPLHNGGVNVVFFWGAQRLALTDDVRREAKGQGGAHVVVEVVEIAVVQVSDDGARDQ